MNATFNMSSEKENEVAQSNTNVLQNEQNDAEEETSNVKIDDIEDIQLQIEELLISEVELDGLYELAKRIGIDEKHWYDQRRLKVIAIIRKQIESDMTDIATMQLKKERLINIMKTINEVLRQLYQKFEEPRTETNVTYNDNKTAVKEETQETRNEKSQETGIDGMIAELAMSRFKKDFVIAGKVGEKDNEKDIGYLGVVRQMKEAAEKKYSDKEIVAAVLKAVGPKHLKTYLAVVPELTTVKLTQILRLHYQEKSATELYQELISMKQKAGEKAIEFVVRAFETREKILVASKEEGEVPYDKQQVQKLCLSTIESGIDKDIALIIRPCLMQTRNISDVEIMNEVHQAEASLILRLQKDKDKKAVKISAATTDNADESAVLQAIRGLESKLSSVDDLKKEMKTLKEEFANIKYQHCDGNSSRSQQSSQHSSNLRGSQGNRGGGRGRGRGNGNRQDGTSNNSDSTSGGGRPKCLPCHEANVERCDHCYKCGSAEHIARGCLTNRGNRRGLSSRGR